MEIFLSGLQLHVSLGFWHPARLRLIWIDQAGVGFTSLFTAGILSMARTPLTSMSQEAESSAPWPASSLLLQVAISGRAGTGQKNTPTPTPGWPEAKAPSPGD